MDGGAGWATVQGVSMTEQLHFTLEGPWAEVTSQLTELMHIDFLYST